jgi:hypothetical protein
MWLVRQLGTDASCFCNDTVRRVSDSVRQHLRKSIRNETKKLSWDARWFLKKKNHRHFFAENHLMWDFCAVKSVPVPYDKYSYYGTGFWWLIKPNECGNTWCDAPPPSCSLYPLWRVYKMLFVPPDCGESLKFVLFHSLHRVWQIPWYVVGDLQDAKKNIPCLGFYFCAFYVSVVVRRWKKSYF